MRRLFGHSHKGYALFWKKLTVMTISLLALTGFLQGCTTGPGSSPAPEKSIDDATINAARYECLLGEGIPVTRGEDGSINYQGSEENSSSSWDQANEACDQELVRKGLISLTSSKDLEREYDLMLKTHQCLEKNGFPVEPWPSKDVYVDQEGQFNLLAGSAPIDVSEAQDACRSEFTAMDAG